MYGGHNYFILMNPIIYKYLCGKLFGAIETDWDR